MPAPLPESTRTAILALVASGATYAAIAAATGAGRASVRRLCAANEVQPPARSASMLPSARSEEIRAAIRDGGTDLGIARALGCTVATVCRERRKAGVKPCPVGKWMGRTKKISPEPLRVGAE